jgi:quercetin dioxygenase-like cupin family protein
MQQIFDLGGFKIQLLKKANDSNDHEIFHATGPKDTGPGPHYHQWQESFFVIDGSINYGIGPDTGVAQAGDFFSVAAETPHWFKFGEAGGAMLIITSTAKASNMFADFHNNVNWTSPDRAALIALAAQHGQKIIV